MYQGTWFDRLTNAATLAAISLPEFFVAYVLMFLFAVKLRWLPTLATPRGGDGVLQTLWHLALPVLTLTLVMVAYMMRMTRTALLGVIDSPFVEFARLKGVSEIRILLWYALPNAWAPIATVIAFNLAYLVTGVVIVEVIFVYPGIGQTMVDAVRTRDIPVVQACALIFASTYILLNLLADIVSIATNPRLLHPR
jgi:peptide/nickel transport system permease protein